jgi:hypothetical protein
MLTTECESPVKVATVRMARAMVRQAKRVYIQSLALGIFRVSKRDALRELGHRLRMRGLTVRLMQGEASVCLIADER